MKIHKRLIFLLVVFSALCLSIAYAYELPKWFPFNHQNALREWQEKIFKNKVLYVVEPKREGGYLVAKSTKACSGLFYKIKIDARRLPMISWNWKVVKFPEKKSAATGQDGWIERDDYAARVYVIFSGWNFLNIQSIEYIWAENLPAGKIITSPNFSNLKLIVVESGKGNMGKWVFEERNIADDYHKAFGRSLGRPLTAIALMTDSDNSLSTAEAFYKDIKVGYKK